MSTSPESATSVSISKSEYYSSLPWFRRWLAMLNWRPVVDYELREIEFEKQLQQLESEDEQLKSESLRVRREAEQIESEIEQIKKENARLSELNSKLDAIVFSSATNSTPTNPTPSESET